MFSQVSVCPRGVSAHCMLGYTHPRSRADTSQAPEADTPPGTEAEPPGPDTPPGTRGKHLPWDQRQTPPPWDQRQTPPPGTRGRHPPRTRGRYPLEQTPPRTRGRHPLRNRAYTPGTRHPPGPEADTLPNQRQTPPEQRPPWDQRQTPPGPDTPLGSEADTLRTRDRAPGPDTSHPSAVHAGRYGQQVCGTHPIGMHSCLFLFQNIFSHRSPLQETSETCEFLISVRFV